MRKIFGRLRRDQNGAAVTEFGIISIPLFTMLMGVMDISHSYYVQITMNGALQKLGRNSSLEGAGVEDKKVLIDASIRDTLTPLLGSDLEVNTPNAAKNMQIKRRFYKNFDDAAKSDPEPYRDFNDNQTCDNAEAYDDINNNNTWDADGGDDGQGAAKDVVVIQVEITYPRLFPVAGLIGLSNTKTLTSDSILANQPYGEQQEYAPPITRSCT